jgi:hypothetical protein
LFDVQHSPVVLLSSQVPNSKTRRLNGCEKD